MNLFGKVTKASLTLLASLGITLANATENMPGGPAVNQINFAAPATKIMEQIHGLHIMMLIICAVIFIGVFGVMFYAILKHRKSLGHKSASFHESTTVEIIWTVVPLLIVIGMALPATKTVVAMKDTTNSDITIKVTGYQWKWGYDYIKGEGEGINFLSTLSTSREAINNLAPKSNTYLMEVDNEMVVPVGKKIRLITTANDVIHSWTIPAFGVKQDAIPGFVRDTWFRADQIGTFRGQCSELCGAEHAFMPIVVKVVSPEDYTAWVADKQKAMTAGGEDPAKVYTLEEQKARGEKVYAANCAACHQPNGKGAGAFPALDGDKVVNGPKAAQFYILLNGKNAMPKWGGVLSDADIAAVITYTRNAWGNHTGEVIQTQEIITAHSGK
ncbi:cytochrome c oxidase subunit II [Polynucleobacter paneuropaeus]|jgi:cytochrome c oxidase subunit 2|uniref:Cytochrome c oxidase subunit 2 n=1 Tax=Polynucleobacter paneuropaeus TaxID=2527775 RepID=A0A9Q7G0Y1_9BURK|nr:cytochrome c oxidase subunit II [Polynucleobacter paneuropaeus]AWW46877.1 cytochrome c oxidase subunit II [Polynucleobacter paneuropaeus]AWW48612.1 cytochrome c oxidase subunit II [Polynucleobacter paneuropaeus]MBT8516853.1 cytochrome c oxidase subunit II [Polynucleobacter paneuropaeus]MBT8517588.1 cytochrome c oxidase subunit II [Polynucleobacter paneuropaeus]MBT8520460.1 cytochrome c oxidase subunit II [Polynucleobacter paneuropaeus]